jgi:hypothetical protein
MSSHSQAPVRFEGGPLHGVTLTRDDFEALAVPGRGSDGKPAVLLPPWSDAAGALRYGREVPRSRAAYPYRAGRAEQHVQVYTFVGRGSHRR